VLDGALEQITSANLETGHTIARIAPAVPAPGRNAAVTACAIAALGARFGLPILIECLCASTTVLAAGARISAATAFGPSYRRSRKLSNGALILSVLAVYVWP
jgi:hypothetical protein